MRVLGGLLITISIAMLGCGPANGGKTPDANGNGNGDGPLGFPDADPNAPDSATASFAIYAHGDHTLYTIDLQQKTLKTVGPFKAPLVPVGTKQLEDVITDLAVAPDNTIYVISETAIYTADPIDGHVTKVGSSAACGTKTVALTTTPDGKIWAGDYKGAICEVDITTNPPTVKAPAMMQGGLALSGDFVAVDNGTVFGTAYKPADPAKMGTNLNNILVTVDVKTGAVTQIGTGTGYPKLFGTAYANGQVFGFTHDTTGHVVTIDRTTGVGTIYATFTDPATNTPISFAGAGVNSLVVVN